MNRKRNIAIILAGGMGSRVGGATPKQLLPLADGRSILEHSIDAFEQVPSIDEIAVVMHPDYMEVAQELCRCNTWQKVNKIIPGGTERWESSWHAILAYMEEEEEANLWLHDAARPFVSQRILFDVATALEQHEAVTVAVPVTDTLYKVNSEELTVNSIPPRSEFMRAQTPQAFDKELITEAYLKALAEENVLATDDVGIVRKYAPKHPIFIVQGEEANKKITYASDL